MVNVGRRRSLAAWAVPMAWAAGVGLSGCERREPLLRIATSVWIGYESLYLAQARGWIDRSRVRLIEAPSSTDALHLLASGNVEAVGLTLDELLSARADQLDIVAVLVFDESHGGDGLLARADITGLPGLAGRRIGVERSAVGAFLLHEALTRAGLGTMDVIPVYLRIDQHLDAWRSGRIDAIVSYEPVLSQIEALGARRLFDSRGLTSAIVDVLAVQRAAIRTHRQGLLNLIRQHFRVRSWMAAEPAAAAEISGRRLRLPAADVERALAQVILPDIAENRRLLKGRPSPLQHSAEALERVLLGARLLEHMVVMDDLFDDSLLPVEPLEPWS
ncbi:NitT/TauT family transport system substrate-binding protein [Sphaerotilus hippei]|uniref:NitT/TauT family transport system substrate-binding protein n=1 Tax=Sphaerotilus hippei TaxID=744406 RepID=A0A318HBI2_9BURK|nr:ABC transporter substrate-binding protein [Sphaerotilus hippei]PXW98079.1 NitT/TauT family transport system substrate-binding protein [Sphaerotilus hippei]